MRVVVCGSETFTDEELIYERLDAIHGKKAIRQLVVAEREGASAIALEWSKLNNVAAELYVLDWKFHGPTFAPFYRNNKMLEFGKPDRVLSFGEDAQSRDLCRRAEIRRIPVIRCHRGNGSDTLRCKCKYKLAFGECRVCGGRGILEGIEWKK